MARRRALRCWWADTHVADLEAPKPWDLRCRYTTEALERWPIGVPLLSCSLPVASRPANATNFVRGLLPEGRQLQAVADRAKVTTNDYYGLLAHYGRDVAGALVITTDDTGPRTDRGSVAPYSTDELADEVATLDDNPLGLHADSELSIAGIQNKLLLVKTEDGRWGRPVHGYPSTHILKVDDERFPGLIRAEAECLALAHAIGLTQAAPRLERIGDVDCLIVARHDRGVVHAEVMRLHQEDACQALDVDITAAQGRGKYEHFGGPSLHQVAELLRVHAGDPARELASLLRLTVYTTAIGNADLHGKNISLLHDDTGHISLAPAYDTVPTMMWPKLRSTSAVSVAGHVNFADITLATITAEAVAWGLDSETAQRIGYLTVEEIAEAIPITIENADLAEAIEGRIEKLRSSHM